MASNLNHASSAVRCRRTQPSTLCSAAMVHFCAESFLLRFAGTVLTCFVVGLLVYQSAASSRLITQERTASGPETGHLIPSTLMTMNQVGKRNENLRAFLLSQTRAKYRVRNCISD